MQLTMPITLFWIIHLEIIAIIPHWIVLKFISEEYMRIIINITRKTTAFGEISIVHGESGAVGAHLRNRRLRWR